MVVDVQTRVTRRVPVSDLVAAGAAGRADMQPSRVDGPWNDLNSAVAVRAADHLPRLARWGGAPNGTILCSPDSIFGHHRGRTVRVSGRNGLAFSEPFEGKCRPRHVLLNFSSLEEARRIMRRGGQTDPYIRMMADRPTYRYFRQSLQHMHALLDAVGVAGARGQINNLSLYLSDKKCLTNFHWDRSSGIVVQFRGRKRVWLVAPEHSRFMISSAAENMISSCFRRSRFIGREEMPEVDHISVVVGPGEALFIPPRWWHQVESLDDPTVGMIVRFDDVGGPPAAPAAPSASQAGSAPPQ